MLAWWPWLGELGTRSACQENWCRSLKVFTARKQSTRGNPIGEQNLPLKPSKSTTVPRRAMNARMDNIQLKIVVVVVVELVDDDQFR